MAATELGYNERLFQSGGLRSYYHHARYGWATIKVRELAKSPLRIVELGCFDGKLLEFIPAPARYVGLDADWEGGLQIAAEKYGGRREVEFHKVSHPRELASLETGSFDLAVSLETLEHIEEDILEGYLEELRRVTAGHILISVPNELGPIFLAKHIAKRLRYGGVEDYTRKEIIAATLFRSADVERNQHKGFDYRNLIATVSRYFDIVSVEGVPKLPLPLSLSLTVGIVGKSRT